MEETIMNKQQMIDFIYDKVSDKNLTEGCKIELTTHIYSAKQDINGVLEKFEEEDMTDYYGEPLTKLYYNTTKEEIKTIGLIKEHLGVEEMILSGEYHYKRYPLKDRKNYKEVCTENSYSFIKKIIGHPVLIGDIDKLIKKGLNYFDDWIVVLDLWIKKDEPIEDQSIECITYIYNLIELGEK